MVKRVKWSISESDAAQGASQVHGVSMKNFKWVVEKDQGFYFEGSKCPYTALWMCRVTPLDNHCHHYMSYSIFANLKL